MNINDNISVNFEVLCYLLEEMKSGELKVTERGLYNDLDDVYIDLVKFDLLDKKGNYTHRYFLILYKSGDNNHEKYLPESVFGPGTEDIVDEFYEVLRRKQRELGIEDDFDRIVKREFEEFMKKKNG